MPNNDLATFLTNTGKALRHSTIHQLNDAVVEFLKNTSKDTDRINYVLEIVCECYDLSKRTLTTSNARGKVTTARNMASVILHLDLGISTRYIAKRVFHKWQNSISRGITYFKRLDPKIKADKEFLDNYIRLQAKLKNK